MKRHIYSGRFWEVLGGSGRHKQRSHRIRVYILHIRDLTIATVSLVSFLHDRWVCYWFTFQRLLGYTRLCHPKLDDGHDGKETQNQNLDAVSKHGKGGWGQEGVAVRLTNQLEPNMKRVETALKSRAYAITSKHDCQSVNMDTYTDSY